MVKNIDIIDQLPLELAAALQCDPFFANIPVVVAEKGNVLAQLASLQAAVTKKGGKWGVFVLIPQMVADDNIPEVAFGPLTLKPAIQVYEQPTQNNSASGTGKSARKVARKIMQVIKPLWLEGFCSSFRFEKQCLVPIDTKQEKLVGYELNFETDETDDELLQQVAQPQFALTNGNASPLLITCATPGAVIYYTTDDTFPAPPDKIPSSTAQVYSGPIDIPDAGFTIRAAAFLAPMIASDVRRAQINPTSINP